MKRVLLLLLLLLIAGLMVAADKPAAMAADQQFDKLKTLAGTWGGTDDEGNTVTVIYKVVSDGSVLMETLSPAAHPNSMITMYHLDKSKLMMTHYCSAGNQPRMRVKKISKDGNAFTFSYVDATNLASAKDAHMSRLVVTFKDEDHFSQDWTMSKDGKEDHRAVFNFERVKQ
jgi:hypothetical protein